MKNRLVLAGEVKLLGNCVDTLTAKADQLARSCSGDERKALDISRLLFRWMINGRMKAESGVKESK